MFGVQVSLMRVTTILLAQVMILPTNSWTVWHGSSGIIVVVKITITVMTYGVVRM